ncbi:hypothetical protein COV06_03800 [Candidatus Uhrbacteria bacterium CG10_big_fil_rev_8_21_14_0_10_50_16]|uniref:DUF304 domain-containing protein n=1 Tax=Candidatus Uhrbacteria bacterium CG10_big_fil_rev_8_21_14_0_10_50_16 TaxID=1975039 RepID=A0A2H0RLR3_9BACT|nr:MAG: hypothetical protein COV06_03800 [Candidatus Uhrbacteria bacterium CG10_big_fil_rev_8_21_14_0_10_50_16]
MRGVQLREGEQIVHVEYASLLPRIPWLLVGLFLTITPFFFFFPFFSFGVAGLIPLLLVVCLGLGVIIRTTIRWRGTVCVLTNVRIFSLQQRGFMDRRVNSAALETIQDAGHRRYGTIGSLFSLGSVRVLFRGVAPTMHFDRIRRPEVLHAIIVELSGATRGAPSSRQTTFERVHLDSQPS